MLVGYDYDGSRKTVVSLPERLFRATDALARKLKVSRSRLYATAIAEYLAKHQATNASEQLDAIYTSQPSELDAGLRRAQRRVIARGEW